MDSSSPYEDTRLSKAAAVFRDATGGELIAAIRLSECYPILGKDRKIITNLEARRAISLAARNLVVGTLRETTGKDGKTTFDIASIRSAPGVLVSQIKGIANLKPPSVSICNKATVVRVLPTTYTHRSSLSLGL